MEPSIPKRILMLVERFPPDLGGLARSGGRIAGALAGLGVEVDVLAWTRGLPAGRLETRERPEGVEGVTLHRLGLFSNWDLTMQHSLNLLEWLHARRRFEAVWGHYLFPAGFSAVLFAEREGLPSTVSARGNDVDQLAFPPGDFARLMWTLQRATVVSAVSGDLARKIRVLLGTDPGVEVISNAVDLELFAPGEPPPGLREALGIRPEERVLGFSGELRHKKGLPFLLQAFAEVREKLDACLLVIGEVRAREQAQLAQFAADFPEDGARILVTGHLERQSQVAEHLRLCDAVLLPSIWEGLPNALLEAMACGRLVVASDAGGIPEVVRHGRDGFLVPRAELHRFGEAILEVLLLPDLERARIGAEARRRVEESFQSRVEAKLLGNVLARLGASRPR